MHPVHIKVNHLKNQFILSWVLLNIVIFKTRIGLRVLLPVKENRAHQLIRSSLPYIRSKSKNLRKTRKAKVEKERKRINVILASISSICVIYIIITRRQKGFGIQLFSFGWTPFVVRPSFHFHENNFKYLMTFHAKIKFLKKPRLTPLFAFIGNISKMSLNKTKITLFLFSFLRRIRIVLLILSASLSICLRHRVPDYAE